MLRHDSALALLIPRLGQLMRRPTLARDIVVVLAIKFLLLMALKYTFFNHPQAPGMELPPADVAQALLSVSPTPDHRQGNHHAQ
jgi:hypothetical protein